MRKYIALAVVVLGFVGFGVTQATADDGAVHFVSCPSGTFTSTIGGFTFTYCFSDIVAPSGNANAHFHGALDAGQTAPDKATEVDGFSCVASWPSLSEITTDTQFVVTPSGEVNGICKFH
jgi:hypothetical protein